MSNRREPVTPDADRWNHNIQYHRVLLDAVPMDARRILDVGCGDGIVARGLAGRGFAVVGLDSHLPSLALARAQEGGVRYVLGDVLAHPFPAGSFDAVVSVAALHHMDEAAAIERLRDLVRPGGTLAIVGVARSRWPQDLPLDAIGWVVTRLHQITKREWTTPAPVHWPPPRTFGQVRRLTAQLLPGRRHRRHVLWRWSVTWTKAE